MKKLIALILTLAFVFSLTACSSVNTTKTDDYDKDNTSNSKPINSDGNENNNSTVGNSTNNSGKSYKQLNTQINFLRNDTALSNSNYVNSYNDFSFSFLSQIDDAAEGKNIMVSPLSMFMAYSLAFNGASGNTLSQFENAFGFTKSQANEFCASLYNKYVETTYSNSKVNLANSIWLNNNFEKTVLPDYLTDATKYYNAEIMSADFALPNTKDDINSWVAKNTNNLIKKIVENTSSEQLMLLINAVLLESRWPKKLADCGEKEFTNLDGSKSNVKFLNQKLAIFYEVDGTVAVKQSLCDGFSFMTILPKENVNISDYVSSLNASKFNQLLSSANTLYDVELYLPKFKYECSYSLNDVMTKMGITDALNPSAADFTKLSSLQKGDIYISNAIQKTYIELDENGIKAAAVTAITYSTTAIPEIKPIKNILLNRPFVYLIMDNTHNIPMFMGVVQSL